MIFYLMIIPIRVDSMSVEEIRKAILLLRDNKELRERMSEASLKHANSLRLETRAQNILSFMKDNM